MVKSAPNVVLAMLAAVAALAANTTLVGVLGKPESVLLVALVSQLVAPRLVAVQTDGEPATRPPRQKAVVGAVATKCTCKLLPESCKVVVNPGIGFPN